MGCDWWRRAAWQLSLAARQRSRQAACLLCQRRSGATPGPCAPQNLSRRWGTRAQRVPQPSTRASSLCLPLSGCSAPPDQLSKTCQNPRKPGLFISADELYDGARDSCYKHISSLNTFSMFYTLYMFFSSTLITDIGKAGRYGKIKSYHDAWGNFPNTQN